MKITGNVRQDHALVAERPLVVMKRLIGVGATGGETPYQHKTMKFGVRYDITGRSTFDIYNYNTADLAEINGGSFHAVMWDARENNCSWVKAGLSTQWYPAIIPVGTKFFLGNNKDVATRSLIVYRTLAELEAVHGKMTNERKPVENYSKRAK